MTTLEISNQRQPKRSENKLVMLYHKKQGWAFYSVFLPNGTPTNRLAKTHYKMTTPLCMRPVIGSSLLWLVTAHQSGQSEPSSKHGSEARCVAVYPKMSAVSWPTAYVEARADLVRRSCSLTESRVALTGDCTPRCSE